MMDENVNVALTTFDNPFDPFTQFRKWFVFDTGNGYNTCAYLGRIAKTSEEFTEEENNAEIERAIDEIIRYDFRNIYKKCYRNGAKDMKKQEKKTVEGMKI